MNEPTHEIEAYFTGEYTAEQLHALQAWINADPASARAFMDQLHFRELVGQTIRERSNDTQVILSELAQLESSAQPDVTTLNARLQTPETRQEQDPGSLSAHDMVAVGGYLLRKAALSRPAIFAYAAAIALLAAVLIIPWGQTPQELADNTSGNPASVLPDTTTPVATLTAERDAAWRIVSGTRAPNVGEGLRPGQMLVLTEGFAQVTTNDGAVAILQSPCAVELIDSPNAIRLHDGKLVGLCHTEQSRGFTVHTEQADITDLGTEFGVEVTADQITTAVFVGQVEVTPLGGRPQSITQNQTATLNTENQGHTLQINNQPAPQFTQRMPRRAIVTAARINIPGMEPVVVPQGVREDAVRSSDFPHEINGIDAKGLPVELLGGDLVQMPIAARDHSTPGESELSLELDFAQPADVYLVIFADQPVPDWLARDYELTTMRVGLDQGGDAGELAGVGPGQSIDFIANVWRLRQPAQGTVVVAGSVHHAMSMYCVIVQPHKEPATHP